MPRDIESLRASLLRAAEERASLEKMTAQKLEALEAAVRESLLQGAQGTVNMSGKITDAVAAKVEELGALLGADAKEKHDLMESMVSNFMRQIIQQVTSKVLVWMRHFVKLIIWRRSEAKASRLGTRSTPRRPSRWTRSSSRRLASRTSSTPWRA